ncbi:hypothetical protein QUF58_01580 [Anaerolineales bacterium HSG24]|nr:hypothetical protein [Anaerolineales bacterium HSG24]
MSTNIVPKVPPGGKSTPALQKATSDSQGFQNSADLKNDSPILAGWIEDTEYTLESLRLWAVNVNDWLENVQNLTPERFDSAYQVILTTANLSNWTQEIGLTELRAIFQPEHVKQLQRWVMATQKAIQALEIWLAALRSWQYMKRVKPEDFEGMVAIVREAKLTDWLDMGIEALREAVNCTPRAA